MNDKHLEEMKSKILTLAVDSDWDAKGRAILLASFVEDFKNVKAEESDKLFERYRKAVLKGQHDGIGRLDWINENLDFGK